MSNDKHTLSGIGGRLRYWIKVSDLSATDFARLKGIPYSTLQNYLRGEREPTASALLKMAYGGELNIHWLVTGEGFPSLFDFPPSKEFDKIIMFLFPEIIDVITDRKKFTPDEMFHVVQYMIKIKNLQLKEAIDLLVDEEGLVNLDELSDMKEYLKDATGDDKPARAFQRPRKRP